MSVFFRKLRVNDSTGTATIIVTDKPISSKVGELAGMKVGTRTQGNITFGVLSLIDPETNQVMKANHPTIKALQGKLNAGDEMKGFQCTSPSGYKDLLNDIDEKRRELAKLRRQL